MSRLLLRHAPRARAAAPLALRVTAPRAYASNFQSGPAPPRLPAEQQAEFERLQREASSFLSEEPAPEAAPKKTDTVSAAAASSPDAPAETKSTDFNGAIYRGAPPEFEGDTNPKTGEVGGPKNEPLRWGGQGDWSYNGRVTDF